MRCNPAVVMTPSPPLAGFHSGGLDGYPAYNGVIEQPSKAGFYKLIFVKSVSSVLITVPVLMMLTE